MPADTPHPDSDLPGMAAFDAPVADSEQPPMGYESALPWLQAAQQGGDSARPPWPGSLAG